MKVLSAVLLLVGVFVYTCGAEELKCAEITETIKPEGKNNLDIDKFVAVEWHEVKTISKTYGDGACTTVKYEKVLKKDPATELDHIKATYNQYKDKKTSATTIYLKLQTASMYKDTFEVYKDAELKTEYDDILYQILNTDHSKYAIIYGCKLNDKKDQKTERISILSSKTTVDEAEQKTIDKTMDLLKLPKFEDKNWVDQEQDKAKCSSSSFGLSTVLSAIVVMFFVLRN